ncbi:MAG: TetR/AcrR family transcriptional regulator, partial [Chitinimonas sp.]|nr:TetR/AcrR family transcriptional regulator [Chitinimonas sp.]
MSTKQKLPRSDKTELRRLHILDAALTCFTQHGFHQTSMRDIATAAGVSLGNLYNHFSGKEALIIEIAALEAAELQLLIEGLRTEPDAIAALDVFVRRYLANCMQQETVVLTIEVMAEAVRNPRVAQHFADNRRYLAVAL